MHRLRLAKDIMVSKLVTVAPEDDVFKGLRLLLRNRITGAPVIDRHGRYLGMLSERSCISVLTLTAREASLGDSGPLLAGDFMATKLLTLKPDTDSFEAIEQLLKHRFSGAPVVDDEQNFLGVFSERYIMRLLINSAYDQVPSTRVGAFMNTDRGRLIDEQADLLDVAQMFLDTYYRRLPVLRGQKLVGQISRRDVLSAEHHLARFLEGRRNLLLQHRREPLLSEVWHNHGGEDPPTTDVSHFMDTEAQTISEDLDFLAIARVFLTSNRRRLPVLRNGKLVGQISRRDLLSVVLEMLADKPHHEQPGLFLSAVMEPGENPALRGRRPSGGRPAHGPGTGSHRHGPRP